MAKASLRLWLREDLEEPPERRSGDDEVNLPTGYGLFRLLGSPRLPSSANFGTAELLDLLKIGLAVIGGLGAVVALAVAYRKQQVNERYVKAAEQLGHERFAVRLAGVYAVVGPADDWPAQRQICVNVLCGYLRTPTPPMARLSAGSARRSSPRCSTTSGTGGGTRRRARRTSPAALSTSPRPA